MNAKILTILTEHLTQRGVLYYDSKVKEIFYFEALQIHVIYPTRISHL